MKKVLSKKPLILAATVLFLLIPIALTAAPDFVGNVIGNSTPGNFSTYWNQVTSENAAKWGSAESSRDNFNWGSIDSHVNYARGRGYPYKFHVLVWGSQEPGWIGGLSSSEQRSEVEEWIRAVAARYQPEMIDVVNEPLHAPASYRNAIGGSGSTGWDWIVWSFEMARELFPDSILMINEYGIINDRNALNQYLQIVRILQDRNLVDGIGIQCHQFNVDTLASSTIQSNLDQLASTGLPIYISELDITGDDNTQRQRYQDKFPTMYNHASVKGITFWGYIQGQTWKANTHLVSSGSVGASERPALTWLKQNYPINGNPPGSIEPPTPSSPTPTPPPPSTPGPGDNVTVRASGTQSGGILELRVANQTIKSWTLSATMADYTAEANGRIELHFTNDDNVDSGLDLQVDYLIYNGTTYEAEDQEVNTAVWNDSTSACGGSYSEQMHCNGYIEFDTGPVSTPVYSPTAGPTATSAVTPLPDGRGLVKFDSNSYTVGLKKALDVDVVVNSGSQDLAAYGITVSYGSSYLSVNTSMGESGVSEGSDGFIAAVNSENPGLITISGFDTDGRGPGTNLHLVTIHFEGEREGDTTLSISVTDLADSSYEPIGVPVGGSASVTVEDSEPLTRDDPGYVGFDKDLYSVNPNGGALNVNVIANTGSQNLAAYGIEVSFDAGYLSLDSSQGDDGISEGDGFVAAAMIESGKITISGFDTEGKGPSSTLPLFTIHFMGENEGTTEISISVSDLADSSYDVVGRPGGGSSSVEVTSTGTKGDVNDDGVVNIVDALMTAQYAVDMDPIGFNAAVADVNCDGVINIVDALMIAQYAVSMIDSFC